MAITNRVAIVGKGEFGQTLGSLLVEAGHSEISYCHRDSQGEYSAQQLDFLKTADVILYTVKSEAMPSVIQKTKPYISQDAKIISAVKGMRYDAETKTLTTTTDLLEQEFPNNVIAALSGPNLSAEINAKKPTFTVIAAQDKEGPRRYLILTERLCRLFKTSYFRPIPGLDLKGLEYGGALKNPLAIATGFIRAYFGPSCNTFGSVIEWGWTDLKRIYQKISEQRFGEARDLPEGCMGDLSATATSSDSRNYKFGRKLGKAHQTKDQGAVAKALKCGLKKTVEGLPTLQAICSYAQTHNVPLVILPELHGIIFEGKDPAELNFDTLEKRVLKTHWMQYMQKEHP